MKTFSTNVKIESMKKIKEQYDIVVCGGGLAGFCAAIAAARLGKSTCIIQNRPVFGGNSSSEIGVTPHGAAAFHAYARETGIISELLIEERASNHAEIYENGWTNSVWDMVMYDMAVKTENLNFHLNTNFCEVVMNGAKNITSILAEVQNAEVELHIEGKIFIDCTGDGLVAHRAGCEWRMGTEARSEFDEPHAPETASNDTMGNSIHFRAKNLGRPVPFKAPDWAKKYKDASYFYDQGRLPKEERGGFWWLEIGVPYHTIHDNEKIRHELTRHALGVWDWMKNHDPVMKERTKNYALDWIGQVPGKRESRRIIGDYFMTEHDVLDKTVFPDEVAFGGWFIDIHTPGGLLADSSELSNAEDYDTFTEYAVKSYIGPYAIPLRALIAKDVNNLLMAGRNISATHAALGTVRVMGTTALMGQAAGTAAAKALDLGIPVKAVSTEAIQEIKQQLLRDGCFLLNTKNEDPLDKSLTAKVTASSEGLLYGAGPESVGVHTGLAIWRDQPQYDLEKMETRKGQLIAIGNQQLEVVSVCLSNHTDVEQSIEAFIYPVEDIWDYRREPTKPLAATMLKVPPGYNNWVDWKVDLGSGEGLLQDGFIRLDLNPNENIDWKVAGCIVPGQMAMYQIAAEKMRRFSNGATLSFKVSPAQNCYRAENVLSGVTRPHKFTNLWRSDPNWPLSQWLQLSWEEAQEISAIELTFPGHLIREYHAYSPFYRDPQCAKDYEIEALVNGAWKKVLRVSDNYQRKRKHLLSEKTMTTAIRIHLLATNGDPAAAIYEVRCY